MKNESNQADKVLVFNNTMYGAGRMKFTVKAKDIQNLPKLLI
jgi:hypothetical protein